MKKSLYLKSFEGFHRYALKKEHNLSEYMHPTSVYTKYCCILLDSFLSDLNSKLFLWNSCFLRSNIKYSARISSKEAI